MIELYKNGNVMSIVCECKNEDDFISEISKALDGLIRNGRFEDDWEFQLFNWLPCIVDICCCLRGYKNNVTKIQRLIAGETRPNHADLEYAVTENKKGEAISGNPRQLQAKKMFDYDMKDSDEEIEVKKE